MQTHRLSEERVLIDDTYNANPDSVRAAIDVLASLPAPRALVLGDMGEVGDHGPAMHREVGAYARERGIHYLLTLGDATRESASAFGAQAWMGDSAEQICETLHTLPVASVLVKGSRFMRMERIVKDYLKETRVNPEDVVKHAV
jgi:murE/murF fusion protein